jgi:squalene-associated FAD-dependent desaturase
VSDVTVIGGGLAGIAAALRCADAGARVTLLEASPRLGGLTYTLRRGELHVDNGQHVFLRCCHAYRALLDRLGVSAQVHLQDRLDIPVVSIWDSRVARLRRNGARAPLHLGGALLRYHPLTPRQRLRAVKAAFALRAVDRADPAVDRRSFGEWLGSHGQDQAAVRALWDLVGVATMNARAADASLALAATVFQDGLLSDATAADLGWATVPLGRLHGDAAHRALVAAGVSVRTHCRVTDIERPGGGDGDAGGASGDWLVRTGIGELSSPSVIVAVPPRRTEQLVPPRSVAAAPGWSGRLGNTPILNVHVVFDRQVMSEPFFASVGGVVQWVFDRTEPSGLRSGQYLAVSLSAADDLVDLPVAALRQLVLPSLHRLLRRSASAEVVDFFVTREREATFRGSPGCETMRKQILTCDDGLYLAGAWTDTGWPATMEGAVRSGENAANAVLRDGGAA